MTANQRIICLFDVDGTLTMPRLKVKENMVDFLTSLRANKCQVGIVGGSDFKKIKEQLGSDKWANANFVDNFDYVFGENGLTAFKGTDSLGNDGIVKHLGHKKLQRFINFCLSHMATIELPDTIGKTGTFVEFRNGMLNICPVGRACSQEQRNAFEAYDKIHKIREHFVKTLTEKFGKAGAPAASGLDEDNLGLNYSIGGQISFDVFPTGWDKTYCLKYLSADDFDQIHFFGDKTYAGGNDYEIFSSDRTIGHTVTSPENTMEQLKEIFGDV